MGRESKCDVNELSEDAYFAFLVNGGDGEGLIAKAHVADFPPGKC